jgi:DNA-binding NarL/FixJ family response regulator
MAKQPAVRIFIVDDHPLVREWLANLLRQQPDLTVCGHAEDQASALAAIAADPPDVAIVDLTLKGGSGMDLIKDLASQFPKVAIVVLSMHEEIYYAERALRAGARAYVMKRESTGQIIEAIQAVLAGRVYANPDILSRLASRMVGRGAKAARGSVEGLSDRELEVFRRLGQGQATRHISEDLNLSIKTVQAYSARIKEKLGLANGAELVREAVRWVEHEGESALKP